MFNAHYRILHRRVSRALWFVKEMQRNTHILFVKDAVTVRSNRFEGAVDFRINSRTRRDGRVYEEKRIRRPRGAAVEEEMEEIPTKQSAVLQSIYKYIFVLTSIYERCMIKVRKKETNPVIREPGGRGIPRSADEPPAGCVRRKRKEGE